MTVTPDQTGNPLVDNGIIPLAQHFQSLHPDAQSAVIQGIENHIANSAPPSQGPVQGAIPVSAPPRASIPGSIPVDGPQGVAPATITPRVMPPPSDPAMSAGNEMADAAQPAPKPAAQPANGMIPVPAKYTAAPTPAKDEYNRIRTSGAGVDQIHNPWAKIPLSILDTLGTALLPGIAAAVPGSTMHHRVLENDAENAAKEEQSANTSQAQQEHEAAGTEEQKALALQHGQDAQRASNAPPPTITTDKGILQWNPETHAYDKTIGNPPPKEEMEGKTVTTADGVMAWNPATRKYDTKVGDASQDKGAITHFLDKQGNAWKLNQDGSATPIKGPAGEQLQGAVPEKTVSPEQQFIDEYRQKNPKASIADAETAYRAIPSGDKPPADRGQNFIDPVSHKLVRVEPGGTVPEGARTAAGENAINTPTMTQRTAAGRAQTVHEMIPEVIQNIESMKDKIGPITGRWTEFMQGKIGTDNPEFAALRANLLMTSSAVALAHAQGRLPENLREEFDRAINAPHQTAANLEATLKTIDPWLEKMMDQGGKGSPQSQPGGGVTLDDINAEVARRKGKK